MSAITPEKSQVQARNALGLSTFAFTICFAVWTIFSTVIGIKIKQQLSLTETQFGLLVGTPILTGIADPSCWAWPPTASADGRSIR